MKSILRLRFLKIPEHLENSCLMEMNSYNHRQIRSMSWILSIISLAYIFQYVLSPRQGLGAEYIRGYITIFSLMILFSLIFLAFSYFFRKKSPEGVKRNLIILYLLCIEMMLMLLNFLDLHFGNELSAYIILLMYLSAALWMTPRSYFMLSGGGLVLLMVSFLIINETLDIEFYQVMQGFVYYTLCLVLYLSMHSIRTDSFLNRATLEEQYKMLETESTTDPLTGLYNRRYLKEELKKELARSERSGNPFCTILIDVDFFKDVNDSYGHIVGDEVLKELAVVLRNSVRLSDKVFRFGGEEFILILPETMGEDALILGERIREKVNSFSFSSMRRKISISLGLAQSHKDITPEIMLQRSDKRLYLAKQNGRNMVVWKGVFS